MTKKKLVATYIIVISLCAVSFSQVTPEIEGDIYSLKFNNVIFSVNASAGAKVSSFQLDNDELLVTEEDNPGYLWGSVLWPAPQSEFGWPPPMELDDGEYTGEVVGNIMRFTSPEDVDGDGNAMQFVKDFQANDDAGTILIDYTLINKGENDITKALWELVRVPVNGLTFWPTGPAGTWGDLADGTVEDNNHTWIDINDESRRSLKFFADGSDGWLAHVDDKGRLFLKEFDDVDQTDFADGEAEIELWLSNEYIELETIGAAATLAPDGEHHYEMTWHLVLVPESVDISIGSAELIAFVNNVLDGNVTHVIDVPFAQSILYPNPAGNTISIKTETSTPVQVVIVDYLGRTLIRRSIKNGELIDVSHLETGIYYYQLIENDNKTVSGSVYKH